MANSLQSIKCEERTYEKIKILGKVHKDILEGQRFKTMQDEVEKACKRISKGKRFSGALISPKGEYS